MRIAMVTPYSWSYPGGVNRHIEALAEQFRAGGHEVAVLAPMDSTVRSISGSRRVRLPSDVVMPEYLVPLGPTHGFKANGSISNLSIAPGAVTSMLRQLRAGCFDVVHIHEPVAPALAWFATSRLDLPLVGTFHAYSEKRVPHEVANLFGARRNLDRLHVRIAVSEAAAGTARASFGGDYRIIPNGVDVDAAARARFVTPRNLRPFRIAFVGQPVERKGLPVLLRAFDILRRQVDAELVLVGPTEAHVSALRPSLRGIRALGRVDDAAKWRELADADVLCAPSLGGESFGMVLTEGLAAGLPVVASNITGYRDVVRDGFNGTLVAPGDPRALAAALTALCLDPERRVHMGATAAQDAQRYAWARVGTEILGAYQDAVTIAASPPLRPSSRRRADRQRTNTPTPGASLV